MESNTSQLEAIFSDSSKLLCLAGAGTGKTHTLVSRIIRLVNDGVTPESILVLTFTNAAADEMSSRYDKFSSISAKPYFGTFHSFCYYLISHDEDVLKAVGFSKVPEILSEYEEPTYFDKIRIATSVKLSTKKLQLTYKPTPKEKFEYKVFHKALSKALKSDNKITFDLLNQSVSNLFKTNHPSIKKYLSQYTYILVDEFQDTDPHQLNFVKSFENSNITIVGDCYQAIFQFRGADSSAIKKIAEDNSWDKIKLEYNYRSTSQICDYANSITQLNNTNYNVNLVSNLSGASVTWIDVKDLSSTLEHETYDSDESFAVLCRTNQEVEYVIRGLQFKKLPYRTKVTSQDENLITSAIDDDFRIQYCLSQLPQVQRQFALRNMNSSDFNLDVFLKENLEDINTEIFEIRNSSEFGDIRRMAMSGTVVTSPKAENGIYVGTAHSAKGLEYDNVYVYDISKFDLTTEEGLNLYYVACTRAKKTLTLCSPSDRKPFGF